MRIVGSHSDRSAGTLPLALHDTAAVRIGSGAYLFGGGPDMGGVSADGAVLWLSGRYNSSVYAISTRTGRLLAKIPVGARPHGLCVWPQPDRHSLGYTDNMR